MIVPVFVKKYVEYEFKLNRSHKGQLDWSKYEYAYSALTSIYFMTVHVGGGDFDVNK